MHDFWHYLTAPTFEVPTWGPFSIAFLAVFGLGFVASIVLYNDLGRLLRKHTDRLVAAMVQRFAGFGIAVFAIGLFFFAMRYLSISAFTLSMRVWLYFSSLLLLALGAYALYYLMRVYPAQVKARDAELLKRRYLAATPAATSADRKRRKRARKRKRVTAGKS
ncbi:MAG TPA: hypothetical protein VFI42_09000 [Thermomicrobiaceae bacterium]|nr:hypothetical protein [Thermomicrobiaceae bacterium]